MARRDFSKRISPNALTALKNALGVIYWYKEDLESYLRTSVDEPTILARIDFKGMKRDVASNLVTLLARNEDKFQRQLLRLMADVSQFSDFSHLARLDDGAAKVEKAKAAVASLRSQMGSLVNLFAEEAEVE